MATRPHHLLVMLVGSHLSGATVETTGMEEKVLAAAIYRPGAWVILRSSSTG